MSDQNPHWTAEKSLHSPQTTVWTANWYGGVIGPIFFDTNVNGDNYMHMLQTPLWPTFSTQPIKFQFIFMQDGAPPHCSRAVGDQLNEKLPNKWVGSGAETDL